MNSITNNKKKNVSTYEEYDKIYIKYPYVFKYRRRVVVAPDDVPISKTAGRTWKINNAPFTEVQT